MTPRETSEALRRAGNLPGLLSEFAGAIEAGDLDAKDLWQMLEDIRLLCPDFEALALAIEADAAVRQKLVEALKSIIAALRDDERHILAFNTACAALAAACGQEQER